MEHAEIYDVALAYTIAGSGEPVVTIHGALIADSFAPLFGEPRLTERYRLIAYQRRGYGESSSAEGMVSISQQARDCQALLRHLGISRAHVVGHSLGGVIALQLALGAPELVHSLALLEPALMVGESAGLYRDSLREGQRRYQDDGADVVVDEFFSARFGGDARATLAEVLPGSFEQAVEDAGTAFYSDLPGLLEWEFTESDARLITAPALVVLGRDSLKLSPRFEETYDSLLGWLPNAEGYMLPDAAHGLQLQNPRDMAHALAGFFDRNPLSARSE